MGGWVTRAGGVGRTGAVRRGRFAVFAACAAVLVAFLALANAPVSATSGGDPYAPPAVVDTNPDPHIVETTITAEEATVELGDGLEAHAQTFNGEVPGPTFELSLGETVIVHFHNHLPRAAGIHWHGIELANGEDGTPYTQDMVPPGGSFIYKFTVTRPGIFWYHPHHHASTDQVFKGMYGMIYVRDPNEAALQSAGILPSPAQTRKIVLSDTTVCEAPGNNPGVVTGEPHAYDDNSDDTPTVTAPWAGSTVANALPAQAEPSPQNLCEGPNVTSEGVENPYPADEDGNPRGPFVAGDIPNIQTDLHAGRTNEGTIVLTNGRQVGGRTGGPQDEGYVPGPLDPGASTMDVRPGQGLRLQIVNAATIRYMRLQLTDPEGNLVPLYRVGGEGGLIDKALEEGGTEGLWETGYTRGEILLPPAGRADVVAAIPSSPASGVLTLWEEDFKRTGGGYVNVPTVPVMHLSLAGAPVEPPYRIENGTELRDATGDPIEPLGEPTGGLLNPAEFSSPKPGSANPHISFTSNGAGGLGVDGTFGVHDVEGSYMSIPHLASTRYAKPGDVLLLSIQDATGAHHAYHLHGFSFQPVRMDQEPFEPEPGGNDFTFPEPEYRDLIDVPPHYRVIFKVRLPERPLADGVTAGGALGRWLFHCHILFHAGNGMLSELVVTDPHGDERPDVNVDDAEPLVAPGETASVTGTYRDPDGDPVSLSASVGSVAGDGDGRYTWTYPTSAGVSNRLVYITATDSKGNAGQIPFYLRVGPASPSAAPTAVVAVRNRAPVLRRLRVTPRTWKRKRGARIGFRLSEPATVRFAVTRLRPERRRHRRARAGKARHRHGKPRRFAFSRRVRRAGKVAIRFPGRLGKRKSKRLLPGRYRLTARAVDGRRLKSRPRNTGFGIVR
jgi:FtsP/CotA-like multicopper oxidase with cupredoxin domain